MTHSRYNPIKLRGSGPSASEIVLRDRDRFYVRELPDEAAEEPQQEKSSDEETDPSRKTSLNSRAKPTDT